jgi:2-keto-4-pentenoate hydratase/2-oxohepta-3-ene-1,7-dioic acid hydratase in catechol pathway
MAIEKFGRVALSDGRTAFAKLDSNDVWALLDRAPWHGGTLTGETSEPKRVQLLAPVTPGKILCVGRNYRAHAKELGNDVPAEPMIFFKPPSAILDPEGAIELPAPSISARVEHEAELGVVIGRRVKHASLEEARDAVFGLTIVCDVTARDLQKKDGQWWRAKGMDTFCPVGPHVVRGVDPAALDISCRVNGSLRQHGSTSDMIFAVAEVIRFVSEVITLEPGDLLATGTPEGVGPLVGGDSLEIDIPPLGTLRARVVARS